MTRHHTIYRRSESMNRAMNRPSQYQGFEDNDNLMQPDYATQNQALIRMVSDLRRQLAEKDEEIAVLKHQCGVWFDDFKQERTDRENAMSRVVDLEKELESSMKKLQSSFNAATTFSQDEWRNDLIAQIKRDYYHNDECHHFHEPKDPHHTNYFPTAHGRVECDDGTLAASEDIIDTLTEPAWMTSDLSVDDVAIVPSDELICPKCSKAYKVDDHVSFLSHIDLCTN